MIKNGTSSSFIVVALLVLIAILAPALAQKLLKVEQVATTALNNPIIGHADGVTAVSFAPNGTTIVTAGNDGRIIVWDIKTKMPLRLINDHASEVADVTFSPDGRLLVTSDKSSAIFVWDTKNFERVGQLSTSIKGYSGQNRVVFTPDGSKIVGSNQRGISVWDAKTLKNISSIADLSNNSIAFGSNNNILAIAKDFSLVLFDLRTAKQILGFGKHDDVILDVAISSDGSKVASASFDKTAIIWDSKTGKKIATFRGHGAAINRIVFSQDNKKIVTSSNDKTAIIWDVITQKKIFTLAGHQDGILSLALSKDGTRLATGSWDRNTIIWDVKTGKQLITLFGNQNSGNAVIYTPQNNQLIIGLERSSPYFYDAKTLAKRKLPAQNLEYASRSVFSSDGTLMLRYSGYPTATLWDVTNNKVLGKLVGLPKGVMLNAVFNQDNTQLATSSLSDGKNTTSYGSNIIIWDVKTLNIIAKLESTVDVRAPFALSYSPDYTQLLASSDLGFVIWDAKTFIELKVVKKLPDNIFAASYAPNGRFILVNNSQKGNILVLDTSDNSPITTLDKPIYPIAGVFSPDSNKILTFGRDGATIWDGSNFTAIATFKNDFGLMAGGVFTAENDYIITWTDLGTITRWKMTMQK
jgi:WD40 repeat protein